MFSHLTDPELSGAAGRKAANLHVLARAGMRVPDGFVIPHSAQLSANDIESHIARLGGYPVAVRSSGELEDLDGMSFAGQYETFLDVSSLPELIARARDCRRSAASPRVRAYLEKHGLSPDAARVSILVQRMIDARVAGVAFSIDPTTGKEEEALVECCDGLGDKLVSGQVRPTRYRLAFRDGSILTEEPGDDGARLSQHEARELTAALLRIQALFGTPQDVEWAIDQAGTLWILQARPITSVAFRTDVEELTNADFKDGGISARVCTPVMFSLYENAMQVSMQRYFEDLRLIPRTRGERWIHMYYGRGYWNASAVKRALARVPGFDEEKFDQDLGIQKQYGEAGPLRVPTALRTILPALPVVVALERSYRRQLALVRRFAPEFAARHGVWQARIARFATTPSSEVCIDLVRVLHDFHAWTERAYFTTIYNNANAQSDMKSFVAKMDAATGRPTSLITLMGGLADVRHMDMQRGIVVLVRIARAEGLASAAFAAALAAFLREHGFHSDAELDLTVPRWTEVPGRMRDMVAAIVASGVDPADPDTTERAQQAAFATELAEIRRVLRPIGLRLRFARGFAAHVARVRTYLKAREEMRIYSTQCYAVVRAYLVEAGRRLAAAQRIDRDDDLFMLSIDQIRDLVEGRLDNAAARAEIAFRRAMYDGYRAFAAPNELGASVEQRARASYVKEIDGKRVLAGLGCSPKQVEGTVRVVASLDEIHLIRKGDVLVTRTTDPGWTPVLGLVAGVITEVGGMLSHAAVIGREYGIPAVLNLHGATSLLRTGMRVRVDGATGVVEILDEPQQAADAA